MTTKTDKKDLTEPDKLQLFLLSIRTFVETHRTRIYIGAGMFLLIVIMIGGVYLYHLNYETSAGKIYSRVFETATKAGPQPGDTVAVQGYKDLIAQYPRSHAAVMAHYRLGNLYFTRHEYDVAIRAYDEFLKKAPPQDDLVTLAYNGLGASQEAKKDFAKAMESYEKAMKTKAASSFDALNYTNIARIHEAMNNPSKAAEFYRKALVKTTDPLMTLYLKRKISILG
jgi:tetratricopeptide (TPR) repeat protein